MKNELFYEYIGNVFYPFVRDKGIQFPIILFVDGHSTHMTFQLSELCTSLKIVLVALYPNATRIMQPADVAAFKPLKNAWKSAILEFKRNNPDKIVNKENFGNILQTAMNKGLKTETIRNGFKACGLYPWNSAAPDYTKCTGKKKTVPENKMHVDTSEGYLTEREFKEIVGDKHTVLVEFQEENANLYNEEFLMLYQIHRKITSKENDANVCRTNEENYNKENNEDEIQNKMEEFETWNNNEISVTEVPEIIDVEEEISSMEKIPVETEDGINITFLDQPVTVKAIEAEVSVYENTGTKQVNQKGKIIAFNNISFIDQPSTSTAGTLTTLTDYFNWPKTPERKGKKIMKRPFVLTSTGKKKMDLENIENKRKEELLKEKIKVERLAKREEKQKQLKEKKETKKDKKLPDLIKKKAVNINQPIMQISNINTAKRKLFNQEDEIEKDRDQNKLKTPMKCEVKNENVEIISNILLKPSSAPSSETENEVLFDKNEQRTSGLCFKCTFNITTITGGIKCPTCNRIYHVHCAKMLQNEGDIFICLACSRKI